VHLTPGATTEQFVSRHSSTVRDHINGIRRFENNLTTGGQDTIDDYGMLFLH